MGKRIEHLLRPGPTVAVAAASTLVAFSLVASWALADEPASPSRPLSAAPTPDGDGLIVSGGLPSIAVRDELFDVLAESADISVIFSNVTITSDDGTTPSAEDLVRSLLADLEQTPAPGS